MSPRDVTQITECCWDIGRHTRATVGAQRQRLASKHARNLKHLPEPPEQETRQDHRSGQRQHPCHRQVAYRRPLQAGMVRGRGTRNSRRQHVRRTYRQPEPVRRADCEHGCDFRSRPLTICKVLLANLLSVKQLRATRPCGPFAFMAHDDGQLFPNPVKEGLPTNRKLRDFQILEPFYAAISR